MTVCKVLLFGLKPCDISSNTNEKISETAFQTPKLQSEGSPSPNADYLKLDIKPLLTPISSRSSTSSDTGHESSPIRVIIRETTRGRHRICVSQTLLRTHTGTMQ